MIAFSVGSESVHSSMIDGEYVMKNRRCVTVDEEALKKEVRTVARRVMRDHRPAIDGQAEIYGPSVKRIHRRVMDTPWP
jgi:hypothetical protein